MTNGGQAWTTGGNGPRPIGRVADAASAPGSAAGRRTGLVGGRKYDREIADQPPEARAVGTLPPAAPGGRGARSLTERTRQALLEQIHDGAFADDRLPPEAELAVQLGVSRTTLRAALHGLEADGLLTRRRRFGTFVNRHVLRSAMRLNRLVPFSTLIAQQGHEPGVRQSHRVAPASAAIAEVLRVAEGAPCVHVDRLLLAGGDPVITVEDVVPVAWLAVPLEQIHLGDSTFEFIAHSCRTPVDYSATDILARVARDGEPAGLLVVDGEPYTELLETHFSRDHDVVGLSRVRVDGSRVRLSFIRRDT